MRTLVAMIALLAAAGTAAAQSVPEKIGFQGKLTNAANQPVNGAQTVTFRLYAAATGGTAFWSETQSITVVNGLYTAYLGEVTPLSSLPFNAIYWLSVEIGNDGEMVPRTMFAHTPYAIRARVAETLEGMTSTVPQLNQLTGGGNVDALHSHSWTGITGKPAAFPPTPHGHLVADIPDLATAAVTLSGPQTISGSKVYAPATNAAGLTIRQTTAPSPTSDVFAIQSADGTVSFFRITSLGTPAWTGAASGDISGNAATVTNGVYSNGSYADPSWLPSLSGSKILGAVSDANSLGGLSAASYARLAASQSFAGTQTFLPAAAGQRAVLIQGAPGQTANLMEWRADGGALLASVDATGAFSGTAASASGLTTGTYGNVLIFTNPANSFTGSGSGLTDLSASNITTGTLSLANGGTGAATAAGALANLGGASLSAPNTFSAAQLVQIGADLAPGVVIRANTPAQTGPMQLWQNSAGQTRASMSAAGKLVLSTSTGRSIEASTPDSETIFATSGSATAPAVRAQAPSVGVLGLPLTADGIGIKGEVSGSGPGDGRGVEGVSQAQSGIGVRGDGKAAGVQGLSGSTSGKAVHGVAYALTGTTYGVYGESLSPDGFGLYTPNNARVDGALGVGGTLTANALTAGTITGTSFVGSGALLTGLSASFVSSGTLSDARLSTNVMLASSNQTITGTKTFMPAGDATGLIVRQSAVPTPSADVFNVVHSGGGLSYLKVDSAGTVSWSGVATGNISGSAAQLGGVAASNYARLNQAQVFTVGQTVQSGADVTPGLVVRGNSPGQVASLQEWQDQAGVVKAQLFPDGRFLATATSGSAIFGNASSSGSVYGVVGTSANGQGGVLGTGLRGVTGQAMGATGVNYGVHGSTGSPDGIAVYGEVGASMPGAGVGVKGVSFAVDGYGVYGQVNSPTGYGLYTPNRAHVGGNLTVGGTITGSFDAGNVTAGTLPPVRGGTGNSAYAPGDLLYASNAATLSRLAAGANGKVLTLAGGLPTWGDAHAHDHNGQTWTSSLNRPLTVITDATANGTAPLLGWATGLTGQLFGVYGRSHSEAGRGVFGFATSATGGAAGVYGECPSTAGFGVFGVSTASTGFGRGVWGESLSTGGTGVMGFNGSATGNTSGVYGHVNSPDGVAVSAFNPATTGLAIGASAQSWSTSGRAIMGYAGAASGTTYGVYGQAVSPDGYGLYTPNRARVEGTLLVGETIKLTNPPTRTFSIPAAAFRKSDNGAYFLNPQYLEATAGGVFFAPVHLPHGAVITGATLRTFDNDPAADVSVQLIRLDGNPVALSTALTSTAAANPAWQTIDFTPTAAMTTVDNTLYSYYVHVFTGGTTHRINGAKITYTISEPLP